MANANSTGAPAPDQPTNPFIVPGDADGTRQAISEIIAFLRDRWMAELELCGAIVVTGRVACGGMIRFRHVC